MGAQIIKHINWDDLATSGWKHLFPKQSNFKKFEEIWRFILLIRSLSRRCARRQNLNVVVWGILWPFRLNIFAVSLFLNKLRVVRSNFMIFWSQQGSDWRVWWSLPRRQWKHFLTPTVWICQPQVSRQHWVCLDHWGVGRLPHSIQLQWQAWLLKIYFFLIFFIENIFAKSHLPVLKRCDMVAALSRHIGDLASTCLDLGRQLCNKSKQILTILVLTIR